MRFGLKSTRIVHPEGISPGTVVIAGGRIEAVELGPAEIPDVTDFGDQVIPPGLVDCHVHVNEPGRTEWEGFATATRAAAAGGVTTLVDMPLNSSPVTTTAAALDGEARFQREDSAVVDVGLLGRRRPGNTRAISRRWRTAACSAARRSWCTRASTSFRT